MLLAGVHACAPLNGGELGLCMRGQSATCFLIPSFPISIRSLTHPIQPGPDHPPSLPPATPNLCMQLGQKIAYKFSFWGTGLEGETSLSYEQNWGVGETWTTTVTMESGAAVEVVVPPHGAADACMSADEGTMRVRFKFKQFLSGTFRLAVAWADGRKEQKTAPLEELMVLAGMENCKEVTEDLTLKGYCNKALSVRDGTLTPTQSAAFRSLLMPTAAVGEVA